MWIWFETAIAENRFNPSGTRTLKETHHEIPVRTALAVESDSKDVAAPVCARTTPQNAGYSGAA
jgi:hypothetical protein